MDAWAVRRLSEDAILPTAGSENAAGYDLSVVHDLIIKPHDIGVARTDLEINLLCQDSYMRITGRSGRTIRQHLHVVEGIIDNDNHGEIKISIINHSGVDVKIRKGERVAQAICEKIARPKIIEVANRTSISSFPNSELLLYKKLSTQACTPTKRRQSSAGFTLYSAVEAHIGPLGKIDIKTDIAVKPPTGTYCRIAPLLSTMPYQNITTEAGVIDEDYRGNIKVILFNHSRRAVHINQGDKIAVLICEKIGNPIIFESPRLDATDRGSQGLGSSGIAPIYETKEEIKESMKNLDAIEESMRNLWL